MASFGFCLVALIVGAALLIGNWIPAFLSGIVAYRRYTSAPSAFDAIFGHRWSVMPAFIMFAVLATICIRYRKSEPDSTGYVLALGVVFATTAWAMPANFDPLNQLLMLPTVFLFGRILQSRRTRMVAPGVCDA